MMDRPHRTVTTSLVLALLTAACSDETESATKALPRELAVALFGREHATPVADNPSSPEKIVLGRDLYHEQRLSKNGNISCASCHPLDRYGQDGEKTSPGTDDVRGDRNAPSSINAFRHIAQFWDGRAATVEEQATGPVLNPIEHGVADAAAVKSALEAIDGMPERFRAAFPGEADPVSLVNFGKAVAAFERTLRTRSPFDDYLDGDAAALTAAQKAGLKTFVETGCTTCHIGRTVGGGMYQKLGLVTPYPTEDIGRAKVTGNDADKFFFKVPSLLNVAETAPYFHDGSIATLEEAVEKMARHQLGRELDEQAIASIIVFLNALTGPLPE